MKDKIITFTFLIFILTFSVLHLALKDKEVSMTERRKLATFPTLKLDNEYISKVDKYLLDHFPFRDEFRSIKARFNLNVLNLNDNNGIYLKDNYIFKSNYPTNKKSINNFKNKITYIKSLLTENNNAYMMIIPDKNYYLENAEILTLDYDYLYNEVGDLVDNQIDVKDLLELKDYYETDTHWKQENIEKVIKRMSDTMNFKYSERKFEKHVYDKFYGVYYGESAINRKPENITYLTNDVIDNAKVFYLENDKLTAVYNKENLSSLDSYEVFLDGASAYIEITNPLNTSGRELVIFRDSFGSSITPLLIEYYSKITVIDNRYINSVNFLNYIEFKNQDVLFLFSTMIINESGTLKG